MTRLLCALGILTASAASAGVFLTQVDAPARGMVVIGNERPVFLGNMTVTATALPAR